MKNTGRRRDFIKNMFIAAGVAAVPASAQQLTVAAPYTVDFILHFPQALTQADFEKQKTEFENTDKITALRVAFEKSGKIKSERGFFENKRCTWQVQFNSKASYQEWMALTIELQTHNEPLRDQRSFRLEIRNVA